MLKETVTYKDFNGVEKKEDLYFNLTSSELIELDYTRESGIAETLQKIVDSKNRIEIMKMFKRIIMLSYGEKSDDGRRFIKSKELSEAFTQTAAYDVFFMSLLRDENKAASFINAILPEDLVKQMDTNINQ